MSSSTIFRMYLRDEVFERRRVSAGVLFEDSVQLVGPPARVGRQVPLPVADLREPLRLAVAHLGEPQRGLRRALLRNVLQRAVQLHDATGGIHRRGAHALENSVRPVRQNDADIPRLHGVASGNPRRRPRRSRRGPPDGSSPGTARTAGSPPLDRSAAFGTARRTTSVGRPRSSQVQLPSLAIRWASLRLASTADIHALTACRRSVA